MNPVYAIDLDARRLEVGLFEGHELELDMAFFNVSSPTQLETWDRRIFRTEEDADSFLTAYKDALKHLPRGNKRPELPCMLLKKRYLTLAVMGLKTYTTRSYKKDWKAGQVFQFHDQEHFLPVKLTDVIALTNGEFRYHYVLN